MKPLIALLLFAQAPLEVTLSGTITDAITHQPIAGAKVFYQTGNATTDAAGAWSLHAKPFAVDRMLMIQKPGYAEFNENFTLKSGASESHNFELTPAAHLSGRVIDRDSGEPLAGIIAVADRSHARSFNSNPSGADGSFHIGGDLPPGSYMLEFHPLSGGKLVVGKPKPARPDYSQTWFPGVPRVEMAAPITLSAGENRTLEMRLQKRELHHISAVIQGPEGREAEQIQITVNSVARGTIVAEQIPKAGPFRIEGLDEGSYELYATFLTTKTTPPEDHAFAIQPVDINDRDIDDLKLVMTPGVSIRGIVTMAEKDASVPGGPMMFLGPMPLSGAHALGAAQALQSPDHLYWQGFPSGEYWPMLGLPNGYALVSVTFNGHPVFNTEIDIEAPESTVNFVVTSRPAALTGTIRDSDQNPIGGATVVLLPQPLPDRMDKFNFFAIRVADSDSNGLFHFEDLGPGKYKAIALTGEDRKRAHELQFLHDRMQSAEHFDLDFAQNKSLDLPIR